MLIPPAESGVAGAVVVKPGNVSSRELSGAAGLAVSATSKEKSSPGATSRRAVRTCRASAGANGAALIGQHP